MRLLINPEELDLSIQHEELKQPLHFEKAF
jgi:hypothetical protein